VKAWTDKECAELVRVSLNAAPLTDQPDFVIIRAAVAEARREQRKSDAEFIRTHRATHVSGPVGHWIAEPLDKNEKPDKVAECLANAILTDKEPTDGR